MNEQYFEKISTVEELIIAEQIGFNVEFKTNRPEMPGATLLHESARKCNVVLLAYLISDKKLNINQLDDDECTPLGYVVNDDLWYEIKCGEITSVNEGCNDTSLIIQTIDTLRSYGAKCIYNGEFYNEKWIDQYIVELKKQV